MATKPSDLLGRLPSVNELLEKPPIRALADRWNRSVVAAGVRSFLDELRSDLERRAADVHLPSLRELAERAARHVAVLQQSSESVRQSMRQAASLHRRGAARRSPTTPSNASFRSAAVTCSMRRPPTPGDARTASASPDRCRSGDRRQQLFRRRLAGAGRARRRAPGRDRAARRRRTGAGSSLAGDRRGGRGSSLREVGAVNRTSAADFEAAIGDQTAAIVRHTPDHYRVAGDAKSVELEALVGLARDRELPLVDLLGAAPLVDGLPVLEPAIESEMTSIAASIAAGAHLVVGRGDGLVGGPRCGIIVGTRGLVERIESHPLFAAWRADPATCAALRATLDALRRSAAIARTACRCFNCCRPRSRISANAPSGSHRNSRKRRTSSRPLAVPSEGCLGLAHLDNDKLPSYAIALTPAGGDLRSLELRLRNAPVPIRRPAGR